MTDTLEWVELKGHITEDGKLEIELPQNFVSGDVDVWLKLKRAARNDEGDEEEADRPPFTDEEIRELLTFTPKSGKEIVESGLIGGWEHMGIEDSVEWVNQLRKKEEERRDNSW